MTVCYIPPSPPVDPVVVPTTPTKVPYEVVSSSLTDSGPLRSGYSEMSMRGAVAEDITDVNYRADITMVPLISKHPRIRQMIYNVLTTLIGEDHFEPTFGSNLPLLLFDAMDGRTTFAAESNSIEALTRCMRDRINVLHNMCTVDVSEEGEGYIISIAYQDIMLKTADRFSFTLMRG
jgi:phage baseplate assembly protein W